MYLAFLLPKPLLWASLLRLVVALAALAITRKELNRRVSLFQTIESVSSPTGPLLDLLSFNFH